MEIKKYNRYWAVYDENGELICITVYKKGAKEVLRRFELTKKTAQLIVKASVYPVSYRIN